MNSPFSPAGLRKQERRATYRPFLPREQRRFWLYALSLSLDLLAVAAAYLLAVEFGPKQWIEWPDIPILLVTLSFFVMFSVGREAQSTETLRDPQVGLTRALSALLAAFLVLTTLFFVTQAAEDVSRLGIAIFFGISAGLLVLSRILQHVATRLTLGDTVTTSILLLDGMKVNAEPGMIVVDLAVRGLWPDLRQPGMISAISTIIDGADRVLVACKEERYLSWSVFLQGADVAGEILVGTDHFRHAIGLGRCADADTMIISRGPLSMGNRIKKRAFDLVLGSAMLIALAPLLLIVSMAIKLESRGPVFFRQIRVGKGNRYFKIFKFRSMHVDQSDHDGNISAKRADPRVTRVGAFIRKTSIDELPQLLNVILGDMSLVGPRPHALGSLAGQHLFWDVDERYWKRHSLRPGITGLAQVRGFRGATENPADLEDRLRCDLEYLANWSLVRDVQILFATVWVVVHDRAF